MNKLVPLPGRNSQDPEVCLTAGSQESWAWVRVRVLAGGHVLSIAPCAAWEHPGWQLKWQQKPHIVTKDDKWSGGQGVEGSTDQLRCMQLQVTASQGRWHGAEHHVRRAMGNSTGDTLPQSAKLTHRPKHTLVPICRTSRKILPLAGPLGSLWFCSCRVGWEGSHGHKAHPLLLLVQFYSVKGCCPRTHIPAFHGYHGSPDLCLRPSS